MNPWDNDPIVQSANSSTATMPWDNDPIVSPASELFQGGKSHDGTTITFPEQNPLSKFEENASIFPSQYENQNAGPVQQFMGSVTDVLGIPKRAVSQVLGTGDMTESKSGVFNHLSESYAEQKKPELESLKHQAQDANLTETQRAEADLKYKSLEGNVSGFSMLTDILSDPVVIASLGAGVVKGAIKKFLGAIGVGAEISTEKAVLNAAAERSGIPLTAEQKISSPGSQLPEGLPGTAEKVVSSTPISRGVMETHKKNVKDAVMSEIQALKGTDLTQEEIADRVANGITKNLKNIDNANSEAYQNIIGEGSLGINVREIRGNDISKSIRSAANAKAPIFGYEGKNVPTGLNPGTEKIVRDFDGNMKNIESVPQEQRYQIFRNEKTNLGKAYADAQGPDKIALKSVYDAAKKYEEDFLANYGAFYKIDRDRMLETLRKVNSFYAETKPIRDFEKKAVGFNTVEGERGYANAQGALNSILDPKKSDELQVIMKLNPEELNESIRAGLLTKIFDKSKIENSTFISLSKLQREVDKYGLKNLEAVIGKDRTDRIKDLMIGMQRARTDKLSFADPTNKSGTIAAGVEKVFYGGAGPAALAGFFNPAVWVTTAATTGQLYINRLIAKVITGTKFNKFESAVGKASSSTVGAINKTVPYTSGGNLMSNLKSSSNDNEN
jgi:hypothetical protein